MQFTLLQETQISEMRIGWCELFLRYIRRRHQVGNESCGPSLITVGAAQIPPHRTPVQGNALHCFALVFQQTQARRTKYFSPHIDLLLAEKAPFVLRDPDQRSARGRRAAEWRNRCDRRVMCHHWLRT
jgi:hypothetical protein